LRGAVNKISEAKKISSEKKADPFLVLIAGSGAHLYEPAVEAG
jgi:hypothetical protein